MNCDKFYGRPQRFLGSPAVNFVPTVQLLNDDFGDVDPGYARGLKSASAQENVMVASDKAGSDDLFHASTAHGHAKSLSISTRQWNQFESI